MMFTQTQNSHTNFSYRTLTFCLILSFTASIICPPGPVYAQNREQAQLELPPPWALIKPSQAYTPTIVKGLTLYPDNPLKFDFIIDTGDDNLTGEAFEEESIKLIRYFLASLTIPEDDMWVNLSPHEGDRIIPDKLSVTQIGMDMLAQDYLLKQLTASLIHPEDDLGQAFWERVYRKAYEEFGTTDIPINTFNKV